MQEWLSEMVGKDVTVITRNDETEHTGTLLAVDLDPLKHGMGPSAAIDKYDGTRVVAFDVEYIDEMHEDDV